jgi:hypothetical protein
MEITYRDLERKVLDSYYTPLFEVLRFFIDSRALTPFPPLPLSFTRFTVREV